MRRRIVPVIVILSLAGGAWWWMHRARPVDGSIRLSGNVEVTEVDASFRIGGRLIEVNAEEGDTVTSGEIIARVDTEELQREVEMRAAEAAAQAATVLELSRGNQPQEIAAGLALLNAAEAEVKRLEPDAARQKELFEEEVISRREYEATEAAYLAAVARRREAAERLALLRQGPRTERIAAAQARETQALEALALARTRLGFATLASPLAGVVLARKAEPGEFVAVGAPVLSLADLSKVWIRAFLNEPDLARVRVGSPVTVTVDGLPGRSFRGRLDVISSQAEFTPKTVQTDAERVKLVYRVKITLENPDGILKPGMPADAVIVPE